MWYVEHTVYYQYYAIEWDWVHDTYKCIIPFIICEDNCLSKWNSQLLVTVTLVQEMDKVDIPVYIHKTENGNSVSL
jgi:hypothetical protein